VLNSADVRIGDMRLFTFLLNYWKVALLIYIPNDKISCFSDDPGVMPIIWTSARYG